MSAIVPDRFTHLSFDCYGTLIDWERGILEAVTPVLTPPGSRAEAAWIVARYADHEAALEAGPYISYADVLRGVMERLAVDAGVEVDDAEREVLVRSVGRWVPFADTVDALERLATRYALVIASNVDDAIFEETARMLGVPFAAVITAEQVRSYKPARPHFDEILARTGAARERVLHVAQSLYHDHVPAQRLGFTTAWVNRPSVHPGVGVARAAGARPDLEVPDLASLAEALGL